MMKTTNRRSFLKTSGKSVAGVALAMTAASYQRVRGASERVNLGLIGCGGRGTYVIRGLAESGASVTHLCDLMPSRLESTAKFLSETQPEKPKLVHDMQRVFADKDVQAVVIATPDHWHGPAAIMALQAGKDVYVEKPHAHNIWESEMMIKAARESNRILQVGTQNRSGPYNLKALDYLKTGRLGKISFVKVFNMKPGVPFHLGDPGKKPRDFNWDAWLGRAPLRPYHQRIFLGGWHHFWDFSGGDMADDGIHQIDLALMLMQDPGLPKSVRSVGGRYAHRGDDSESPDLQVVNYDFGDFIMTFELTGYPRYMRKTTGTIRRKDELPYWTQNATRIELYGSDLMMIIGRHGGGWVVMTSGGKVLEKVYGRPADVPHYKNFLECVKSRQKPNADIAIAHQANTVMHMGNIAHRVGNTALNYDSHRGRFDNSDANKLIKPFYRKPYEIADYV